MSVKSKFKTISPKDPERFAVPGSEGGASGKTPDPDWITRPATTDRASSGPGI